MEQIKGSPLCGRAIPCQSQLHQELLDACPGAKALDRREARPDSDGFAPRPHRKPPQADTRFDSPAGLYTDGSTLAQRRRAYKRFQSPLLIPLFHPFSPFATWLLKP
ncbi:hypothetical protein D3C85_1294220 [compost metagenome]